MPKGFDLRCAAGKTARVWLQGRGGGVKPGYAAVLLPPKEGETGDSSAAYIAPLWQALIDDNTGHVNLVVCESDYRALKRGIEQLPPHGSPNDPSNNIKHANSLASYAKLCDVAY